jgi:hypothetical protein
MNIFRPTPLVTALVVGTLAMSPAPASGAIGYANLCPSLKTAFCTAGTIEPGGVAVDNSSGSSAGDVWVVGGTSPSRLVKFDASGNQLAEVGEGNLPGSAAPFGSGLVYVAVDPVNGDIYASASPSSGTATVTKFNSSGVFQFQLTGSGTPQGSFEPLQVAVDPSSRDLYVIDSLHEAIDKFTSSGQYVEQFPVLRNQRNYGSLAVDSKGNLYVGLSGTGTGRPQVREYGSTGASVNCPSGSNIIYELTAEEERQLQEQKHGVPVRTTVAVDPSDDHIFIGEASPSQGLLIAEYSAPCSVPHARLGAGELGRYGAGAIGVSGSTHEVYAGIFFGGVGQIFGQVTIPDVTTGTPATSVTRTSALVSGIVNPDGTSVTACEVEYGTTVGYGHSAACSQALPLTGSSPIAVSAELGFSLPPATLVHYRLKAANSNGSNVGEDETFYTEALPPPVVNTLPASNLSQFAATLNGTLTTGEALVNYHFEYGATTAYGSVAPIPDNYTPITTKTVPVSQSIGGLQAGTTYHYRLVASSPGETGVAGPDMTFTTPAIPAPSVSTGGASGVTVGAATLTGTVDPHGWDTTYYFQYGTSTAYGSSWPTVPIDLGALEGAQGVLVYVQNLLPGTVYHYRFVATNGGGTSYGPDMTLTTAEYPVSIVQEPPLLAPPKVAGKAAKPAVKHAKAHKKKGGGKRKKSGGHKASKKTRKKR